MSETDDPRLARLRDEHDLGTDVFALLTDFSWVHRRVELVRFVDDSTVLRQTSVDFTLPADRTSNLRSLHPAVVLLGTLEKRDLSRFSMWDEDGRRLVLFTSDQNAYFAGAALVALARTTHRRLGIEGDVPADVLAALREVAGRPSRVAAALLACLRDPCGAGHAGALADAGDDDGALRSLVVRLQAHATVVNTLMRSSALAGLAEELASQFIVLTELHDGSGDPDTGRRRLLKYSYEEPPAAYRPSESWRSRTVSAIACRSGLWPETRTLDRVPVGTARGYHVEIEAPDDIEIIGSALVAEDPGRKTDEPKRSQVRGADLQRIHLRVTDAPRAYSGPVWVQFRAMRAGLLTAALITAWIMAVLLALGQHRVRHIDTGAAATLLLTLPTILVAYLLRPGEHQLASRLLLGPRLLLLGSAGCCFVAAGALAGGFTPAQRDGYWSAAAGVAVGLAVAQTLTYVLPYAPQVVSWAAARLKR